MSRSFFFAGLRIADHFGNFFQRNVTDLEFGNIDSDKAIAAKIKHEAKLDEKSDAHFQCAVLYTSAAGQRRVRVHNLSVPITSLLANVFRSADMDTTIAYIAKDCTFSVLLFFKCNYFMINNLLISQLLLKLHLNHYDKSEIN